MTSLKCLYTLSSPIGNAPGDRAWGGGGGGGGGEGGILHWTLDWTMTACTNEFESIRNAFEFLIDSLVQS